jgi:fibronectin type 3 domain-containing protein
MNYRKLYLLFFTLLAAVFFVGQAHAQAVPDTPANVAASQNNYAESITVSWDPVAGVELYRVHRSASSSSVGTRQHDVHPTTSFVDENVSYGKTYYYRVVSLLDGVESTASTQVSAKPIVPAPLNVEAANIEARKEINITWKRPTDGLVLTFDIHRSTKQASAGGRIATKVNGTNYRDTKITDGTRYFYRVRARSASDKTSSDSNVVSIVADDTSVPGAPKASVNVSKGNTVRVSWNKPSGVDIDVYRVYRSRSKNTRGDFRIETTSRSYTEHALNPGTYYFRVVAVGASGNSSPDSDAATAVVSSTGVLALMPVSELTAAATGRAGEIKLTWKTPDKNSFSFVRVYRNTFSKSLGSLIADNVRGSSYTDKNATNGITYYYVVRTVSSRGEEHQNFTEAFASAAVRDKNSEPPPGVTKLEVHDAGDGRTLTLSWENPGPTTYDLLKIYRSTSKSQLGEVLRTLSAGTQYIDRSNVQTDQSYYYRVITLDKNGVGSENNQIVRGIASIALADKEFDTDGDGLPDSWERTHGYHPHLKDAPESDEDEDGLGVLAEYQEGTDPWNADSDSDGYTDGTEVLNGYSPLGPGKKVAGELVSAGSRAKAFAYNRTRLSDLSEEQARAQELKAQLEVIFGTGRVPNSRKHWHKLVNAFIYGGYTAEEIAHTLSRGPGLVHPVIAADEWRNTSEYKQKQG